VIYVGIDNGLLGGIVAIDDKHNVIFAEPTPVIKEKKGKGYKNHYDLMRMRELLALNPHAHVTLEKGQAIPMRPGGKTAGVSSSAMHGMGRGYGLWEGLLVGMQLRYSVVHPKTWQGAVCRDVPGDTKTRAIITCQRELPGLDLTPGKKKKPHDGMADAACMALFGLSKWGGDR
jgi:crossover junction endodeoxyribonuclease RuvC